MFESVCVDGLRHGKEVEAPSCLGWRANRAPGGTCAGFGVKLPVTPDHEKWPADVSPPLTAQGRPIHLTLDGPPEKFRSARAPLTTGAQDSILPTTMPDLSALSVIAEHGLPRKCIRNCSAA